MIHLSCRLTFPVLKKPTAEYGRRTYRAMADSGHLQDFFDLAQGKPHGTSAQCGFPKRGTYLVCTPQRKGDNHLLCANLFFSALRHDLFSLPRILARRTRPHRCRLPQSVSLRLFVQELLHRFRIVATALIGRLGTEIVAGKEPPAEAR